jgi:hypothetical protein
MTNDPSRTSRRGRFFEESETGHLPGGPGISLFAPHHFSNHLITDRSTHALWTQAQA